MSLLSAMHHICTSAVHHLFYKELSLEILHIKLFSLFGGEGFCGKEVCFFKVCKSMHQHTFQINQPTRCNSFLSLLLDVYMQLNMFQLSSRPSSGTQQLQ